MQSETDQWIVRSLTALDLSVSKLSDQVGALQNRVDSKIENLRTTMETVMQRHQQEVNNRLDNGNKEFNTRIDANATHITELQKTVAELKTRQMIAISIASIILVPLVGGLVAIAVPHLFGDEPTRERTSISE
jgi:predicted RNase H-like nuclease (RuvC/YqgF family)